MAFRFWRRVKIAPGVTLNLSKSGGSLSFGPKGAKVTIGPRGKRATVGIPGTGLFYTVTSSKGKSKSEGAGQSAASDAATLSLSNILNPGFFKRLMMSKEEVAFIDGLRELYHENENKALEYFQNASSLADGAYIAGFLALRNDHLKEAERYLRLALARSNDLGKHFSKYGIKAGMVLPITEEIEAFVSPDIRSVLLGLVELYQQQKRWDDAIRYLEKLQKLEPEDVVVKLSLAELLLVTNPDEKETCKRVVQLAEDIENEAPIHAALLLYKARALKALGLLDAAKETLNIALRRKKDRSEELLRAIRYERALVYEALGNHRKARVELEKIYSEDPSYEDVEARLGL